MMRVVAMAIGLGLWGTATAVAQADSVTAFVDVSVVTMEREAVLPGQTVVVRGDRIVELGPAGSVKVPAGARRIDGRGKYLLPGLADMHVHLGTDPAVQASLRALFVGFGVTSVLNLSGTPSHLALRERIARGEVLGPTLYTSGPIHNDSTLTFADGERIAAAEAAAGFDYIKVYNQLSRPAYWGIVSAARRAGIPVVGHVVRGLDSDGLARCDPTRIICHCEHCLESTLTSGQINIVHMEEVMYGHFNHHATKNRRKLAEMIPEIPAVGERIARSGVWLTPTLEVYINIPRQLDSLPAVMAQAEMRYLPATLRERWGPEKNPYRRSFRPEQAEAFWEAAEFEKALVKGFHDAGVKLLAGTDVGVPAVVAGISLHWELQHLVSAGLTPYQALVTATRHPAEFFGKAAESGTVSVGKVADLLLVDANPLADIRNTLARSGVMVRGRWIPRAEIHRMLESLRTGTGEAR